MRARVGKVVKVNRETFFALAGGLGLAAGQAIRVAREHPAATREELADKLREMLARLHMAGLAIPGEVMRGIVDGVLMDPEQIPISDEPEPPLDSAE